MSALTRAAAVRALPRPDHAPAPARPRTPLTLLPGGGQIGSADSPAIAPASQVASRTAFAVLMSALVLGTLLVTLILNIQLASGAFTLLEAQQNARALAERSEELTRRVTAAESPASIERAARNLGMVPAASPVFLRLMDGKVLGRPVAAEAP